MMSLDIALMAKNKPTKSKFRFFLEGTSYKEPEADFGVEIWNLKKYCAWMFQLKQE